MDYFRINHKGNDTFIHFFNRGWSIYSSINKPNLLRELQVDPIEFVNKTNALFAKYQIVIPKDFPKHSTVKRKFRGKNADDFPYSDLLICIHCCNLIEEEYKIDTSKILRWELIKPNSDMGIHHACSMALIAYYYLKEGYEVMIPFEKEGQLNPDLIINNLKCEIKTNQKPIPTKKKIKLTSKNLNFIL